MWQNSNCYVCWDLSSGMCNRQVCLWYSFLLNRGAEVDLTLELWKIFAAEKREFSEAAIEMHSSERVYSKMLFFIIIVLHFWLKFWKIPVKKLNFSKVQGFQPHVLPAFWECKEVHVFIGQSAVFIYW